MDSYRERAVALRTIAQNVQHADNKEILLTTANRYDQLAHLSVRPVLPRNLKQARLISAERGRRNL